MGGGKKKQQQQSNKQQQKQKSSLSQQDVFDEQDEDEQGNNLLFGLNFNNISVKEILFCIVISTFVSSFLGPFVQIKFLQYRTPHPGAQYGGTTNGGGIDLNNMQYDNIDRNNVMAMNAKRVTTTINNGGDTIDTIVGGSSSSHDSASSRSDNSNNNDSGGGYHQYYDPASRALLNIESKKIVQPTLCSDGINYGFADWTHLELAIRQANAASAESFLRGNQYYASSIVENVHNNGNYVDLADTGAASSGGSGSVLLDGDDSDSLYYEHETILSICPGTVLKSRGRGSLYINAENIILECGDSSILDDYVYNYDTSDYYRSGICTFDHRDTHLSFGPHAKNVLIKGITFRGIQHTSSLTFYHDGADVVFEDCFWLNNVGNGKHGAVADVNSTSIVSFHRCEISDTKYVPLGIPNPNGNINLIHNNNGNTNNGNNNGGGFAGASSLTIRTNNGN